jgi:hypothetical protein
MAKHAHKERSRVKSYQVVATMSGYDEQSVALSGEEPLCQRGSRGMVLEKVL